MKKFYIHIGAEQQGPFDINDLKFKGITKDTHIWYEGLDTWTTADKVDEVRELLKTSAPPPFNPQPKTPPPPNFQRETNHTTVLQGPEKKSPTGRYIWIGLIAAIVILIAVMIKNNPNAIPGVKVQVNTPKPIVISTQGDENNSTLLKLKVTVHATIQNQGGGGNVLVTFHALQGGNDYKRAQSVYLNSNESRVLTETIDDVTRLGGQITYQVEAIAQ